MRLLLQLTGIGLILSTVFCLLAQGIGHRLPNMVIAYNETCNAGATNTIYVADWRSGLRVGLPESAFPYMPVSWSPDGEQFAYGVLLDGTYQIYIHDFRLGTTRNFLPDQFTDVRVPMWSPNGHLIAMFSDAPIAVADALTDQIQIFPLDVTRNVVPQMWSPDGDSLAAATFHPGERRNIALLNVISGDIQDLTHGQFDGASSPAWSPDGNYLTFTAMQDTNIAIFLANLQTGTVSQLSQNDGLNYFRAAWSPDGRLIAASTDYQDVYLFDLHGQLVRKIALRQKISNLDGGGIVIKWSPDGAYLILQILVNSKAVNFAYHLPTGNLYSLSPHANCYYSAVDWRPDPPT